ncbi:MAG: ribonuclease E/G [Filifactor alocis]|nr:ribonuclease E/G [Filifactor alocis]
MKKLIVEKSDYLLKIAYIDGSVLKRVEFLKTKHSLRAGQIYKGIIRKKLEGLSAYFVDLGEEQGFLQSRNRYELGDAVLLQVKTEAVAEKQAKMTEKLSLSGSYVVYLPLENKVSVSNKLPEEEVRAIVEELRSRHPKDGLILRTSALNADFEDIEKDLLKQKAIFSDIKKSYISSEKGLLYEKTFVEHFFSSFFGEVREVSSNDKGLLKQVKEILSQREGDPRYVFEETPLFRTLGIDSKKLLQKYYKFGELSLVIEKTEAFTAIDVNSGYRKGHLYMDDTVFEVNSSSCKHIVDLIILKNISGIILVDFIDMKSQAYKEKLLDVLKREFLRDHKKVSVLNITSLGIVQIIRKRDSSNVTEELLCDCPYCFGSGSVPGKELLFDSIQSEIEHYLLHHSVKEAPFVIEIPYIIKQTVEASLEVLEKKYERKFLLEFNRGGWDIRVYQRKEDEE